MRQGGILTTKLKCTKCGFEDEGKFCSNCGSSLTQLGAPSEQRIADIPQKGSWLDKCPACKSGTLSSANKKKLFGLVTDVKVECDSCHARFDKKSDKYQLSYINDESNLVWQQYGYQILEEREWKNIAYEGLSDEKQKEIDLELWAIGIKSGHVPRMSNESPVMLKKNEELILSMPNVSLLEPRAVTTGGYGGPSFRVAKGVSFRVGAFQAQSHDVLKNIDQGTFTLTNTRVVFSGSKRSVNIPFGKIISIEPYSDAIALRREGKEKTQYFTGINRGLTISRSGRDYKESFSGPIFMYMIEGLTDPISIEEAIKAYDKAINLSPRYKEAWLDKAALLKQQGKYEEAIKANDKAIEIDPQFAEAWNNKGNSFKELGRDTEADAAFAKAKELGYNG